MTSKFGQKVCVKVTEFIASRKKFEAASRRLDVILTEIRMKRFAPKTNKEIVDIVKNTKKELTSVAAIGNDTVAL